jgi:hypothetical protein
MPAPTVYCKECGKDVSKRSTISIGTGRYGDDRVCRDHDSAKEFLNKKEREEQRLQYEKESNDRIRAAIDKLAHESLVRTLRDFKALGLPQYDYILRNLSFSKGLNYVADLIEEIESVEVSPKSAAESVVAGISTYVAFNKKGLKDLVLNDSD